MADYVTTEQLAGLLKGGDGERIALAVAGANALIGTWVEPPPAADSPNARQAALELAHALYRRHSAVGGVFNVDELVSRLPADLVRPIRDLLEADAAEWGLA